MRSLRVVLPLSVLGLFAAIAACVGDDASTGGGASTTDDGGGVVGTTDGSVAGDDDDDTSTTDGGGSGDAGGDAGPKPSVGTFAWEFHADRAGGEAEPAYVGVGKDDALAISSVYTQATTIGTIAVPAPGSNVLTFALGADKSVKWAAGRTVLDTSAIVVDSQGDSYVAGYFSGATANFGGKTLTNTNTDPDTPAGYYAKLSGVDGSVLWAVSIASPGGAESYCKALAVRGKDVAIACDFRGSVRFETKTSGGGAETTTRSTAGAGEYDEILIVLDPADTSGRALWSKHIHGTALERPGGVAFDAAGNVLVAGITVSPKIFIDTDVNAALDIKSTTTASTYILRFGAGGTHSVSLAKGLSATTTNFEAGDIAASPDGDIVVVGNHNGTSDFGKGALPATAGADAFVLRLDNGGTTRWAVSYGGSGTDRADSVAVDAFGQIAVLGTHQSSSLTIAGKAVPDFTGARATHVAKLDATGKGLWAYAVNGTASSYPGTVAFLSGGDVVYSGAFKGAADLGNGTATQSMNGGNQVSLFVVRRSN